MKRYLFLFITFTFLSFLYAKVAKKLIKKYSPEKVLATYSSTTAKHTKAEIMKPTFPPYVLSKAFKEEIKYRFIPFLIICTLIVLSIRGRIFQVAEHLHLKKVLFVFLILTGVASSIPFGMAHGGWINIFQQGGTGLFWAILISLFIKDSIKLSSKGKLSALSLYKGLFVGIIASTLSHAMFNLTIYYLSLLA